MKIVSTRLFGDATACQALSTASSKCGDRISFFNSSLSSLFGGPYILEVLRFARRFDTEVISVICGCGGVSLA